MIVTYNTIPHKANYVHGLACSADNVAHEEIHLAVWFIHLSELVTAERVDGDAQLSLVCPFVSKIY